MDPEPKYVSVSVFDPKRSVFLVSLKTKNVPGALGDVATRLGNAKVNILSTSNYALPDRADSLVSFFAEAEDTKMREGDLDKVVKSSPYVLDSRVRMSDSGFMVDDFAFPLVYFPSGRGVLFPQSGITAMFEDLVKLFGSGGESILFRAGYAVGREGSDQLAKFFGEDKMVADANSFTALYGALGWGKLVVEDINFESGETLLRLMDGFESLGVRSTKPNCHFTRGLVTGSTERLLGKALTTEEQECASMGASFCRFRVVPR